jgi:predicted enzyme related to lactoylglutathione lyase
MPLNLHGLRTVIYPAPDLGAATRWWSEILGVDPYFAQPFYVGFNVGGYELGLLPDADPSRGALTYWGVDDVAAALATAVSRGATVHAPTTDVGDGIVTASFVTPTGSIVGVINNPHFIASDGRGGAG